MYRASAGFQSRTNRFALLGEVSIGVSSPASFESHPNNSPHKSTSSNQTHWPRLVCAGPLLPVRVSMSGCWSDAAKLRISPGYAHTLTVHGWGVKCQVSGVAYHFVSGVRRQRFVL